MSPKHGRNAQSGHTGRPIEQKIVIIERTFFRYCGIRTHGPHCKVCLPTFLATLGPVKVHTYLDTTLQIRD